jgi:hypothetical protein
MTLKKSVLVVAGLLVSTAFVTGQQRPPLAAGQFVPENDPIVGLVARLDLEKYKATIKALTQFGDRVQGTDRNRAAVDWIEAQLESYGCATERHRYDFTPPKPATPPPPSSPPSSNPTTRIEGGSRPRGVNARRPPNNDLSAQPDQKLRALNAQPTTPGPREQVYCTKVGATRPDEMYILGAHMDGRGFGEAANDNASGTALVMELARVLNSPDVRTARSIRFVLWNNEESGSYGARMYIKERAGLQGLQDPPGSGRYPEPRWLGMIQHDMMMWDHGMPRSDGTLSAEQRPEADVNIEFQSSAALADEAMRLAFHFREANEKYATDYPAAVGNHMTNTDSGPFMHFTPSISLRENERGMHTGAGWNPHWHQPTDLYRTFSDKDFRLGLNAAQTTLGGIAELAGVTLQK